MILAAFCTMMGVKGVFHHHYDRSRECGERRISVCVLDGRNLCYGGCHNHDSFIPEWKAAADDCAICQFQIVEIVAPDMRVAPGQVTALPVLYCTIVPSVLPAAVFSCGSRAPPVG